MSKSIPDVPLAGRLKHFVGAWLKITQDPKILDIVKGYKIPFHSKRLQSKIPSQPIVSREGEESVKLWIKEMLKKRAIRKVQPSKGEFVSNLFLVKKKDGCQRPVINLKQLNAYIPYCHFKLEGLKHLKYMLRKEDYMCKLDLKDVYFSGLFFSSPGKNFKAICSLPLVRNLLPVPLPLLWFGTSTTNIYKIAKSVNDSFTENKYQNNNLLR